MLWVSVFSQLMTSGGITQAAPNSWELWVTFNAKQGEKPRGQERAQLA